MMKVFVFCCLSILTCTNTVLCQQIPFAHLTVENGLSGNSVISITQDAEGFMWYGTQNNGLSKYDGVKFTNYVSAEGRSGVISSNTISALLTTADGTLWIATSKGLNTYNRQKDRFEHIPATQLLDSTIYCLMEDSDRNLWVGTKKGLYLMTDRKKPAFKLIIGKDATHPASRSIRCLFEDSRKQIWVGTQDGVVKSGRGRNWQDATEYKKGEAPASVSGNYITSIVESPDHQVWIGTQDNGLNRYDPQSRTFSHYLASSQGLVSNNIRRIICNHDGSLWIGTQEGLSVMNPTNSKFSSYIHQPGLTSSISNNSIHAVYQDANKNIWIGTYFAGVNVAYAYNTPFTVYQFRQAGNSISNNVISSVVRDNRDNLWIGTEGGGLNYFDRNTGLFQHFKNNPQDPNTLSSNLIKKVYKDSRGYVWVGMAYNKGVNLFDPRTRKFSRIEVPQRDINSYDEITAILEDAKGVIWIGGQSGLHTAKPVGMGYDGVLQTMNFPLISGKDVHTLFEDSERDLWIGTSTGLFRLQRKTNSISRISSSKLTSDPNVNCIVEDSKGIIWIGTRNIGLLKWDPSASALQVFSQTQGLADNNVWGIVEDGQQNLWLSTENGLSKFSPAAKTFITYNIYDGLPGSKFNANSYMLDDSGMIWFGSYNGLISFKPSQIQTNQFISPVKFTGLKLFNQDVLVDDETDLISKRLEPGDQISFESNQNVFSIEFAMLNYIKPAKNLYAYKLDGFDKQWNYTSNTWASYTNVPPGRYKLLIRAANNDGIWTKDPVVLNIRSRPPLWQTWWAYTLYAIGIIGVLFLLIRFLYLRALFNREYELQQLKLNFFTNISHEIRTHLTLILAPVEKLFSINKGHQKAEDMLHHIKSNADRLLELVTELMDFRKAETNNLPLHVTLENMNVFLADIARGFHEVALQKQIHFSVLADGSIDAWIDKKQMTKVFVNLISNAFKFTPVGGKICVELKELAGEIAVSVKDNGRGIAPGDLEKIFTNYYQVEDNPAIDTGYGIGLALSRSLTVLHRGRLLVESSQAAPSTCFTVLLKQGNSHFTAEQLKAVKIIPADLPVITAGEEILEDFKKPIVLIVEDNVEVRTFIRESLGEDYQVLESSNGREGLATAFEQLPDLVISDIMMPDGDGLSFCKALKTDERTSHVPVILLTAKNGLESHVEGLETGADLYLTKPFSLELLELQVRNLIATRVAMRQKYAKQILLEPQNVVINDADEQFLARLMAIIEEHISDAELGVPLLTQKIGMSKPVLYRKLKALTDMSVHDFIVSIRMKTAQKLLQQKEITVAEVAYAVGYSDRKYFSKEFKRILGKSPSEFVSDAG